MTKWKKNRGKKKSNKWEEGSDDKVVTHTYARIVNEEEENWVCKEKKEDKELVMKTKVFAVAVFV